MVVPVSLWCEMKTLQVHLHKVFSWLSFILNEIVKHRTINKQTFMILVMRDHGTRVSFLLG